jgi:hypothetical protein
MLLMKTVMYIIHYLFAHFTMLDNMLHLLLVRPVLLLLLLLLLLNYHSVADNYNLLIGND